MRCCVLLPSAVVCVKTASTCTYNKPTENKCHFLSHRATLSVSTSSLSFTILSPPPPPSLPAFPPPSSLGGHFLPVSTSPGWGVWSEPLQLSLSPFSLSLSRSQSVFPFSCSLSVDSPLSHRSGLHYLPSSPSSKMTFSDFTKARHFDSVKSPQSRGEGEKKETCVMSDVTG